MDGDFLENKSVFEKTQGGYLYRVFELLEGTGCIMKSVRIARSWLTCVMLQKGIEIAGALLKLRLTSRSFISATLTRVARVVRVT